MANMSAPGGYVLSIALRLMVCAWWLTPLRAEPASLLFKSGFEQGVVLEPAYVGGTQYWQRLVGSDTPGFTWPMFGGQFQYLVDARHNLSDFIVTRIDSVADRNGRPTRALYQALISNSGTPGGYTLNSYVSYLSPSTWTGDLYVRYWVKFNADFLANLQPWDWRVLWAWKSYGDGSPGYRRTDVAPHADGTGRLQWHAWLDGAGSPPHVFWQEWNRTEPVPLGEWFQFEVFYRQSEGLDGRLFVGVNGVRVFDMTGQTRGSQLLSRIYWFVIYGPARPGAPVYQWIDDVEVWDGVPCASLPCGTGRDGGVSTLDAGSRDGGMDAGVPDASVDGGVSDAGMPDSGATRPLHRALRVASSSSSLVDGDPQEFKDAPALELKSSDGKTLGRYWVQWNESALYMAAEVTDRLLIARSSLRDGPLWDDDSLEVMFDVENDRGATQLPGNDDYKFFVSLLNVQGDIRGAGMWGTWNSDWQSSVRALGNPNDSNPDIGYSIELRIPWASWGIPAPIVGARWGFDLVLNDARASAADIQRIAWANSTDGTVNDPDGWGELEFGDLDCAGDGGCLQLPGDGGDARDAGDAGIPPHPRGCACGAPGGLGGVWLVLGLIILGMAGIRRREHD